MRSWNGSFWAFQSRLALKKSGANRTDGMKDISRRLCRLEDRLGAAVETEFSRQQGTRSGHDRAELDSDNAEDFKQGAKTERASVGRRECVGTLLKIPLC